MKNHYFRFSLLCASLWFGSLYAQPAQAPENVWQEPWEGVPEHYQQWDYPDFEFPATLDTWETKRIAVRETILSLLGNRPERPRQLSLRTVLREQHNGYTLEKFIFDNGVDSHVPGYIAIPSGLRGKAPAILGLHGHGSTKDNIMGTDSAQTISCLNRRQ